MILHIFAGEDQAEMVYLLLLRWGLDDVISGVCADTTASNTGVHKGARVLLEKMLNRQLIYFACRHHMLECIVSSVFNSLFEDSTGPMIKLFERFKKAWPQLKSEPLETALSDDTISYLLTPIQKQQSKFVVAQLKENHARKDYLEFLELALIFIGNPDKINISIHHPGAVHRARWMAKIIYSLKIYLYRKHFPLEDDELCALRIFNVFIVKIYLEYWFTCELPTRAPYNDLCLLQEISEYGKVNPVISSIAFSTLLGHVWYLDEIPVGLSFFDDRISLAEKRRMVQALYNNNGRKKPNISNSGIGKMKMHHFVTSKTLTFFSTYEISIDFLEKDPSEWMEDESYKSGYSRARGFQVTNDVAERAVSLAETFNGKLTREEGDWQNALHSVIENRTTFANCTKTAISAALNKINIKYGRFIYSNILILLFLKIVILINIYHLIRIQYL